jgi:acetyl-CoA C-acetyltransferase
MNSPVIVSAVRTPIGKFQGALKSISATELGAIAVKAAVQRAGLAPQDINETIMGNVLAAGLGQNPARQAAIGAGLPASGAAMTINKVCGSGLKAVALAAQAIQTGDASIVVAGGMESMSRAPYLLENARDGYRLGNGALIDSMIRDGLWDVYENVHMGITAEVVADKYHVSRERQDAYAVESHRRALAAIREGRFKDEIVPVSIAQKKGPAISVDTDESPRADTTLETLAALKPAFKKDGTVTAGNAPGVNDGAAALAVTSAEQAARMNLKPLVRIVGQAVSGIEPMMVMMAPVEAVQKLVAKIGWKLSEVDLVELNEAFSVQAIAVMEELGLNADRVNVNGGAVALGHPIGASGARILVTLIHEMIRRGARRGIAALCLGGGNSVALAVERSERSDR